MREKLNPWMPAISCAGYSLISAVGLVVLPMATRPHPAPVALAFLPFLCFVPMCFCLVGAFLSQLREENRELRKQIQELISKSGAEKHVA